MFPKNKEESVPRGSSGECTIMVKTLSLASVLILGCGFAAAQAPANAPAGANGICKDGTYSTAASKSGACRGHNGVQTWYSASAAKPAVNAAPAPAAAAKPTASMPAPAPAAPMAPRPVPAASPYAPAAAPATPGKKLSPTQAAAAKTAQPGGGPGLVWVNTASNVYHCNGDAFYGKTKAGAYMSESDAKAKGAHGEHGQTCAGK